MNPIYAIPNVSNLANWMYWSSPEKQVATARWTLSPMCSQWLRNSRCQHWSDDPRQCTNEAETVVWSQCSYEKIPRRWGVGLLPTSQDKLLACWQEPYPVLKWVCQVDYLVDMFDHWQRQRVLLINMLWKWHEPEARSYIAEVDSDQRIYQCEKRWRQILSTLQRVNNWQHQSRETLRSYSATLQMFCKISQGEHDQSHTWSNPRPWKQSDYQHIGSHMHAGMHSRKRWRKCWQRGSLNHEKVTGVLSLCWSPRR